MMKLFWKIILLLFLLPITSNATTLNDTLIKDFKEEHYPYEEVIATINLQTNLKYLQGNSQQQDFFRALKTHEKMVYHYLKNGWSRSNQLNINTINAGLVELVLNEGMTFQAKTTYRISAFIHICNKPHWKYRGGNIDEYFKKVVSRTEKCLIQVENLQGPNYPY
ncbi:hypothetical protein [Desulfogranum marinum]|uniref:hypothetical protein n=1 Tax=Desulfogranum marinum TaxID=453220 RepID=UPI0019625CD6|nr:hypothetical protein [Desulfogranum marinum]MBM9514875.1 hypothetical protein [Desulfogranum marinum]